MKNKLKVFIKHLIFWVLNFFITKNKKVRANSLLLIRLDAIGDYLLFRNYLKVIRESEKFSTYHITFVANAAWKELFLQFDQEFVDTVIWVDTKQFERNYGYRYKKLTELASTAYEYVVSPSFSRRFFSEDTIVNTVNAKYKLGSEGDAFNMLKWQKRSADGYFTDLLHTEGKVMFEFLRNGEFIDQLLSSAGNLDRPRIESKLTSTIDLPENYAVLFVGASEPYRKWSTKNFAEVAKFLEEEYSFQIVICGGNNDREEAANFANYFKGNYIDLCGKTSLTELASVLANAKVLISNETSAPHMGVSVGIQNVFVLYTGHNFGRFTPYPSSMAPNYHAIYHPEIEKDLEHYKEVSNLDQFRSELNINAIEVKTVTRKIKENLIIN